MREIVIRDIPYEDIYSLNEFESKDSKTDWEKYNRGSLYNVYPCIVIADCNNHEIGGISVTWYFDSI